jgi:hypothetical protein
MRRRDFITVLSGVAAMPRAAIAQQKPMVVIGYLYSGSPWPNYSPLPDRSH